MDSKTISKSYRHNPSLSTNKEDLNKKTIDTQKSTNQKPNNQLLSSKDKRSPHLSNTALEHASTKACLLSQENLDFNSRVYQEHIKICRKFISRYFITIEGSTKLIIYDTKSKSEKIKAIDKRIKNISVITCITLLPNGNLFCLGHSDSFEAIDTFLIDSNFHMHELPSKTDFSYSTTIYYNRNVYCFGKHNSFLSPSLEFSSRFDLDQNRWIDICSIPWPANNIQIFKGNTGSIKRPGDNCNIVIFKGNILICNFKNINIWIYSIDIDSFSMIPYEFNESENVMINTEERLYLIISDYCCWIIYESDIWDEFSWKIVTNFGSERFNPGEACWGIYNKEKESIYIY